MKNLLRKFLLAGILAIVFYGVPSWTNTISKVAAFGASASCSSTGTITGITPIDGSYINGNSYNISFSRDNLCTDDVTIYWAKRSDTSVPNCSSVTSRNTIGVVSTAGTGYLWDISGKTDGDDYCVRLKTESGSQETRTSDFTIDRTNPSISISNDADTSWTASDTIAVSVSDATAGIATTKSIISATSTCDATRDTELNAGTTGTSVTANVEATYSGKYMCFRTTDNAGNKSYAVSSQILKLDTTNPTIPTITYGLGYLTGTWSATNVTFTITNGTDGGVGVLKSQYRLNGGAWTDYSTEVTISDAGTTTVEAKTLDTVSNESTTVGPDDVKVDTTNPAFAGVASGVYYATNKTITFSDTNLSGATLDDVAYASGDTISTEGVHVFVVTDLAGNSTGATFTIDTTNPAFAGVTTGTYYTGNQTITFSDTNLSGATLNGAAYSSGDVISADDIYVFIVTDLAGNSTGATFIIDITMPTFAGVTSGTYYNTNKTITFSDANLSGATLDGDAYASGDTISTDGVHVFIVTDLVGNSTGATFTIDQTAPTFAGVTSGTYYTGDQAITFSDTNLSGATLDGAAYSSGDTISAEGIHVFAVTDLAGNSTGATFTIDITIPTFAGVISGTSYAVNQTITFSDTNLSGATLDDVAYSSGDTISTDGVHVFVVTDLAGNSDGATFTIDKTNPSFAGVTSGAYYTVDKAITFSDTNLSGATLDGVAYSSGDIISAEGIHVFVVTDLVGNSDGATFTIDKTLPTWAGVTTGTTYTSNQAITFSDTNLSGATLNGAAYSSGDVISADDTYVFIVTDLAGNSTGATFTIDQTAPTFAGVTSGTYYATNKIITFTATDLSGATLDDVAYASGDLISTEGTHVFYIDDLVGNSTGATFTIDKTNPTFAGVVSGVYYATNKTITFSDTNLSGATLNGAAYSSGDVISADNTYVFVVTDLAGNSTGATFTIDTTNPAFAGVASGVYYATNKTITFSDTNLSGATLDDVAYASGDTISTEGVHVFVVTDLAGNSTGATFTIDTTNPAFAGVTTGTYYTGNQTITFSDTNLSGATLNGAAYSSGDVISADDTYVFIVTDLAGNSTGATFTIDQTAPIVDAGTDQTKNAVFTQTGVVDGSVAGVASYTWSKVSGPGAITFGSSTAVVTTISADTDGTYVIRLTVVDNAGNSATNDMTLVRDTALPSVSNINIPDQASSSLSVVGLATSSATNITQVEYFIDTTGSDDAGTDLSLDAGTLVRNFSGSIDISALSNGDHIMYIHAKNLAGNRGNYISQSFTKITAPDTAGPTLTFNPTGLNAQYTETAVSSASLTVTANEDGTLYINGTSQGAITSGVAATITLGTGVGSYSYLIKVVDALNNDSLEHSFTYDVIADAGDTTTPTLLFNPTSLLSQYTQTDISSASLMVTSNEDGTLYVNGTSQGAITSGVAATVTLGTGVGSYSYNVKVIDAAGNISLEQAFTYDVIADAGDTTAPTLLFNPTSLLSQYTQTAISSASLTVTANEDGTLYINGTSQGAITSGVAATVTLGTGLGAHSYNIYVTDSSNNNSLEQAFTYDVVADDAGDTTAPTVTSVTPIAGSTSVSISTTPTVTFNEAMNESTITSSNVFLKKVSDGSTITGTVSYDTGTKTVIITPTSSLAYTTQYYVVVTTSVQDASNNPFASEYHGTAFTTQTEGAPDITSLYASGLVDTSVTLGWTTDVTADTNQYRIKLKDGTYGSWITLSAAQSITGLTANKTYVVQVRFIKGANTVTDTLEFKTAKTSSGIEVHSIDRISTSGPTVGGTYANGYHYRFYATANDLTEIELQFKLANRTNGATTMATASNALLRVTENGTSDYTTGTTLAIADTYISLDTDISDIDSDSNLGGRQFYIDLFYKIPTGAAGVYSTTYGILAQ